MCHLRNPNPHCALLTPSKSQHADQVQKNCWPSTNPNYHL
jgi:hypothetical protein